MPGASLRSMKAKVMSGGVECAAQRLSLSRRRLGRWLTVALLSVVILPSRLASAAESVRSIQVELPGQEANVIKLSWPSIGCWFWGKPEFEPHGYKRFLDYHYAHAPFQLLTTSLRSGDEVSEERVRKQLFEAAQYARGLGMAMVMDLDVRLARTEFMRRYPGELQEILRLRETNLPDSGVVTVEIPSINFADHYTANIKPYDSLSGRLVRIYSYRQSGPSIVPESVIDITSTATVLEASDQRVKLTLPCGEATRGRVACVMATFRLFTPDVFSPHLLEFQRELLQRYQGAAFAGACKDEWGFPGGNSRADDYWYSTFLAEAYARRRPGHELLRDMLLMYRNERGRQRERDAAINHYMEMSWRRNGEVEQDFYRATKEVFGPTAMVATHPTWWPFPGHEEIRKDGLHWWVARRDLAQTDESTPFCVRTSLAKKWNSPLWYNMYYERSAQAYEHDIWRHALGGGRMNFHPIYPRSAPNQGGSLYTGGLFRADCRIRLLNAISTAPIQCPVAVIFGHPSALNWAHPEYADVGMRLTDALWEAGFYADLIPSSEISAGALALSKDGWVQYGPQRYTIAVLYHPQFERPGLTDFFSKAAAGQTALYRVGDWTANFEGEAFEGNARLPSTMAIEPDAVACARTIIHELRLRGIVPQTPCRPASTIGFNPSMAPEASGRCELLDGTRVFVSGTREVTGDPLQIRERWSGTDVTLDALGVAAVRLDTEGRVQALAAGGLRSFKAGALELDLPERIDLALWREPGSTGRWRGLLQGWDGDIPPRLAALTSQWTRLRLPVPDP